MQQIIRLQLLLVFMLLQCLAPFAHAHVDGQNADHHVHLANVDLHQHGGHLYTTSTVSTIEDDSQVVSLQPEFRSKKQDVSQDIIGGGLPRLTRQAAAPNQVQSFSVARITIVPYQHPSAQAPPV